MPLYQLLGGASRTGIMAYGHASGRDLPELFDSIRQHLELGLPLDPGADLGAGHQRRSTASPPSPAPTASATTTSRPSAPPLPAEEDWDTRAYLRHMPGVFEAVRNEFGPELPLLHDGHHRMTPIQAAQARQGPRAVRPVLAGGLHPGGEPGGPAAGPPAHHHAAGHRRGLQHRLGLPDADPRAADRLRPLRGHPHRRHHARMRKLLDYAAQYQIKSGIHGPTDISPVGMAAALHLDLAIHNFGIQEYMQHGALHQRGVPAVVHLRRTATCTRASSPGLGVELDEDAAAPLPVRAGLPAVQPAQGRHRP